MAKRLMLFMYILCLSVIYLQACCSFLWTMGPGQSWLWERILPGFIHPGKTGRTSTQYSKAALPSDTFYKGKINVLLKMNPGFLPLRRISNEGRQTDTILITCTEPCDRENVVGGECSSQLPFEDSSGTAGGPGGTGHGGQHIQVLCVQPDMPAG